MLCPNCNSKIVEGGSFCPECGMRLLTSTTPAAAVRPGVQERTEIPVYQPTVYTDADRIQPSLYDPVRRNPAPAPYTPVAKPVEFVSSAPPASPVMPEAEKEKKVKKASGRGLTVLLVLLLIASMAVNVWQYVRAIPVKKQTEKLEQTVAEQTAIISQLEPSAENYDAIIKGLYGCSVGIGANNFSTNRGIVMLSMQDKTKQFWLTANWPEGGEVFMELSSNVASLSYDQETWDVGTTMTVRANRPGVCVVTFRNSVDSNSFKLLIIVTE